MIITTTSQLEGRPVAEYLGVVSAESVQGINLGFGEQWNQKPT